MTECPSCHKIREDYELRAGDTLIPRIVVRVQETKPHWTPDQMICEHCLNEAIAADATRMIQSEKPALTHLDQEVINSFRNGAMLSQNVAEMDEGNHLTRGEQLADYVTNVVGSFRFPVVVLILVALWVSMGVATGWVNTHPAIVFGVLSSALGTLAAIQNPIILMSQRRQTRRDRLRSENDYRVNLKAELEIGYLNEKLDFLTQQLVMQKRDIARLEDEQSSHSAHRDNP